MANVKLVQRIAALEGVEQVVVHPAMGDDGQATGAALVAAYRAGEIRPGASNQLRDAYLGPDYSEEEQEEAMKRAGLEYARHEEVEAEIARLLADGKIICRFNGRMEYGPRALGNRSVLFSPADKSYNDLLNVKLKRTEYMPFAPAICNEDREECFINPEKTAYTAQFMTATMSCTDEFARLCPASVHIDNTARPQFVTKEANPSFHRIITEFKKLTGRPAVVNTSFNMHEEPIVCTPDDAVRAFVSSGLDALAMGKFLAYK